MQQQKDNLPPDKKPNDATEKFDRAEQDASKQWEKEKDIVSGVDKKIENKLEDGTLNPGDIENLGD